MTAKSRMLDENARSNLVLKECRQGFSDVGYCSTCRFMVAAFFMILSRHDSVDPFNRWRRREQRHHLRFHPFHLLK
jgi:hypothetical protein